MLFCILTSDARLPDELAQLELTKERILVWAWWPGRELLSVESTHACSTGTQNKIFASAKHFVF